MTPLHAHVRPLFRLRAWGRRVSALLAVLLALGWLNLAVAPCVQAADMAPDCCANGQLCAAGSLLDCAQAAADPADERFPLLPAGPALAAVGVDHVFFSRTVITSHTTARLPPTPPHPLILYGVLRI